MCFDFGEIETSAREQELIVLEGKKKKSQNRTQFVELKK